MKTDVIVISPMGDGMAEALRQTEMAGTYRALTPKESLRLRLLSEEMMGMLRTIVGDIPANYWVEAEDKRFSLHLSTKARMNADMREELLKTATSGKNDAVKGFMSRIRDVFTQLGEPDSAAISPMEYGFSFVDVDSFDASMGVTTHGLLYGWSMREYRNELSLHRAEEPEKWDELEKSITARLADEVKIFIRGKAVEMVIEKSF